MTTPDQEGSPADAVLDVFRDQCRWMVEGRADLLDGILDDAFTAQHITGYLSPKAEWLGQVRTGEFVYDSIRDEGTTVEVEDGSATVRSRAVHDVTLYGHRGRYRLQSTLHYKLTPPGGRPSAAPRPCTDRAGPAGRSARRPWRHLRTGHGTLRRLDRESGSDAVPKNVMAARSWTAG